MAQGLSKKIKSLQFAFLSPDEIRRMSAIKIITADTYDDDGFPIEMGLMDLHLGVIEPNLRCRTCGGRVNECPGHFGIIELAMPVIHVGYAKEIKRLLQSTCRACGRRLPDAPSPRSESSADSEEGAPRTRETKEERSCPHCHEIQQRILLDKPTTFRESGHKITPKEVRARLERIPDEDVRDLGLEPKFGLRSGWSSPSCRSRPCRSAPRSPSTAESEARTTLPTSWSTSCGSTNGCARTATWARPSWSWRTSGSFCSTISRPTSTTRPAGSLRPATGPAARSRPSRSGSRARTVGSGRTCPVSA